MSEEISREEIAALLARDSEKTCNNKQVSCKLVASQDAISRESVKEIYFKDGYIDFHKICELPPVTPQPKTGHWILVSDKTPGGYWKCSECFMHKRMASRLRLDSFCLCCGADMRESEEQA